MSATRVPLAGPWLTMAAALLAAACWDGPGPEPPNPGLEPPGIASNPVASLAPAGNVAAQRAATESSVVYVSLPPDSIPGGELAFIRNLRTGASTQTAMADGGFDPIAIAAGAGDSLALDIQLSGGGFVHEVFAVPAFRRPRVIRTRPPAGKKDVVLNAPIGVVFSEPVDGGTIGPASLRLEQGGATVVGQFTVSGDRLRAEFQPYQPLAPNTEYVLSVTSAVTDLTGDSLAESLTAEFTTGTTTAVASVVTATPLLVRRSWDNELRSFVFDAILHDDGSVTGNWHTFYPERGWRVDGHVTCFAIRDGNAAWVAGVADSANANLALVGVDWGWRAVDGDATEGGAADQITLANRLQAGNPNGERSAAEFCQTMPTPSSTADPDLELQNVLSGDVVVTGTTPPPPPASLAFTAQPANTLVGRPIMPAVQVQVLGLAGGLASGFTGPITIALAENPGGGSLEGTTMVNARDGIAVFDDLRMNAPGTGYVLRATAEGLVNATSATFDVLAVSPGQIAFVRGGDWSSEIYTMDGDGSGLRQVTHADDQMWEEEPAWSPDGAWIAFGAAPEDSWYIYLIHPDGSGLAKLTGGAYDGSPTWSPDRTQMAFTSQGRIFVMKADWTLAPTEMPGQAPSAGDSVVVRSHPRWSPDGSKLAFVRTTHLLDATSQPYGSRSAVFVINLDGTGAAKLADGVAPAWSPDGSEVAFLAESHSGCGEDLYSVQVDGTNPRQLTASLNIKPNGGLAWSPDGASLVFASVGRRLSLGPASCGSSSVGDLYLVKADGSSATRLTFTGQDRGPTWSAVSR